MASVAMTIRQGDQYPICVTLYDEEGNIITADPTVVSNVAMYLYNPSSTTYVIGKKYDSGTGQITYDSTNQEWQYPLSQSETYALKPGNYELLIRIKFVGAQVLSDATLPIRVIVSPTKEVL